MKLSDKIDTVTITGMGGQLIAEILAAGNVQLTSVKLLILQPNNGEKYLRTWLIHHDFKIIAEQILAENGKIYEIIVAKHGQAPLTENELTFGPFLMLEKNRVFKQKWQSESQLLTKILSDLPTTAEAKRKILYEKLRVIKELLAEI
jgi:tRNA (adenine22-N1)-methyltransferase